MLGRMSIAITEDHRALAATVSDFLVKHQSRAAARALLETDDEPNASFYKEAADLGWLGLHVPEELGGSGYGLEETVVVAEELGRALAPGAFTPTLITSAVLSAAGTDDVKARLLPGLAGGSTLGATALGGDVVVSGGKLTGPVGTVLGAGLADVLLVPVGDDVAVVDAKGAGVSVDVPKNLDTTRRSGRVTLDGATGDILPGARRALTDIARTILAAEAVGVARESTDLAAEYAKVRLQFGRPIAMFQAVKHHCANMAVATELATAAVWDAARAVVRRRATSSRTPRPSPPRSPAGRQPVRQPRACRCTAASATRGSTTATCTCGGRRRSSPCSTPTTAADGRRRPDPQRRHARPHRRPAAGGRADPRPTCRRSSPRSTGLDEQGRVTAS